MRDNKSADGASMNLLIVSQYYWPETFGITSLMRAIGARNIKTTVLTGKPNYPDGIVFPGYSAWGVHYESRDGAGIIRMPTFPRGNKSVWRLVLNYLWFIVAGMCLGPWLLRRRHFDAVFVYAPSPLLQALPAIWLAWLKRAPLVLWVQDLWPESLSATGVVRNKMVLGIVRSVVRFIYHHSDLILISSEGFREPVASLTDAPQKIQYFPNACLDGQSLSCESRAVTELTSEIGSRFSVVFAGNLGIAQSLDVIVEAATILQHTGDSLHIFLVGSGSESAWLADEVARRRLSNVILAGRFPPEAMSLIYAAASALLVSLRDETIFSFTIPSKVQSYMAAGRPIIASLNGEGARIVVAAKAGMACPAGDALALAETLRKLASLPEDERIEMGENARRYARKHFSLDRLADQLAEYLRAVYGAYREKRQ